MGARPGMGKTALALGVARAVADVAPVLIFSLEMPESQVRDRLMAREANVPLKLITSGDIGLRRESLVTAMNRLARLPIFIDDRSAITPDDIYVEVAVKKEQGEIGLVIVDYLGLVRYVGKQSDEVHQFGDMARSLREMARKLEVPLLLLHQLNRAVDSRRDKRPMLSDLRGSGKLEEHADAVVFLYRDEVYNRNSDDAGLAELIIAKHRQGETGTVTTVFNAITTSFSNYSRRRSDT